MAFCELLHSQKINKAISLLTFGACNNIISSLSSIQQCCQMPHLSTGDYN